MDDKIVEHLNENPDFYKFFKGIKEKLNLISTNDKKGFSYNIKQTGLEPTSLRIRNRGNDQLDQFKIIWIDDTNILCQQLEDYDLDIDVGPHTKYNDPSEIIYLINKYFSDHEFDIV